MWHRAGGQLEPSDSVAGLVRTKAHGSIGVPETSDEVDVHSGSQRRAVESQARELIPLDPDSGTNMNDYAYNPN